MTLRKIDGLLIDLEEAEGEFKMPKKLAKEHPLNKVDILSDWLAEIEFEYRKAIGEHFLYMCLYHSAPGASMQKNLEAFHYVVKNGYDGPIPDDLEDICIEALGNVQTIVKK